MGQMLLSKPTGGRAACHRPRPWAIPRKGITVSKRTCSVDGCERTVLARGWCGMHYQRWAKSGDAGESSTRHLVGISAADRLAMWVQKAGTDECWEWQGPRDRYGYGRCLSDGFRMKAHRVMWEHTRGTIPDGLHVCHHCDNPPCCNPDHLFLGTHADNMDDMQRKGRRSGPRGEKNPRAKLSEDAVRTIRSEYENGITRAELARRFGVQHKIVRAVVNRTAWKHVL